LDVETSLDVAVKRKSQFNYRDFSFGHLNLKKVKKVVSVLPLTEHHAMKVYWRSGGTAPPIL
jgi:hypothetical protein